MRFNFGQALAGAARRGSSRLRELEDRANTVADRAVNRFMNEHDAWKRNYDTDLRGYNDAWDKLTGLNLNGVKLDDGQKEMILLGGIEGADKFIAAYEDDQKRKAKEYTESQMGALTVKTPMGEQTKRKNIAWSPTMYTAAMTKDFINRTFTRTSDYQAAMEDPSNPKNQALLKSVGLGQKKASMAYAQGKNPYIDIEGRTAMAANIEENRQKGILGTTIPRSYIQSTIRNSLVEAGVVAPEQIDEKLGANTGWNAPVYNALSLDDQMAIETHVLDKDIQTQTFQMDREKHSWAKHLNKFYVQEAVHKASLFTGEKKLQQMDIAKEELIAKYNEVYYDVSNAKKMQQWTRERAEYEAKAAKKDFEKIDLDAQILDNTILEVKLKEQLEVAMANNDEALITKLDNDIQKVSKAIRNDQIISRVINSTATDIIVKTNQINIVRTSYLDQTSIRLGKNKEPATGASTTVITAPGQEPPDDMRGQNYYLIRNPIDNTLTKFYEGTAEYKEREKRAAQMANKMVLDMLATVNSDGTFTNKFEGDASVDMILDAIRKDPIGSITNLTDYQNSLAKDILPEEVAKYRNAIIAMRNNDSVHPLQRDPTIPSEAEIKQIMVNENGTLFSMEEANELYDAIVAQMDGVIDETDTTEKAISDSEVKFETPTQKAKRIEEEAFQTNLKNQKEKALKSVAETKKAAPYLNYLLKELVENKNTITKDELSDALVKQGMTRDNANNSINEWLKENRNKKFTDRNGKRFRLFSPASTLEDTKFEGSMFDIGGSDTIVMDKIVPGSGL